jgi:tyrosyl-tRNA synthetase
MSGCVDGRPRGEGAVDARAHACPQVDPTGDSLHIGHLVSLQVMRMMRRAGHKPVILVRALSAPCPLSAQRSTAARRAQVGGATALVGDPTDRSEERPVLPQDLVAHNAAQLAAAIRRLPDLHDATVVNNMDWYAGMSAVGFLRDVASHFRVNAMLAKDSVKRRRESTDAGGSGGLSLAELSYQSLQVPRLRVAVLSGANRTVPTRSPPQAYDFLQLSRSHGVTVQVGGSDQWGNITAGLDLIGSVAPQQGMFGVTVPLLTTASGAKFGKTSGNAIWLDEKKYGAGRAPPPRALTGVCRVPGARPLSCISTCSALPIRTHRVFWNTLPTFPTRRFTTFAQRWRGRRRNARRSAAWPRS